MLGWSCQTQPVPDTLVFIPAWNEEESLPAVLEELHKDLPGADVLVVDDGSTDDTSRTALESGAAVLSFPRNRGLPAAIAAGYGFAAEHDYEYCGRVDADGQHLVAELRSLLEVVRAGSCDVAVGSRFAGTDGEGFSRDRYRMSRARRLGSGALRRSMGLVLGQPFHDATSGMYAANARAIAILAHPYTSTAPEVEAVLRLDAAGLRVREVPVEMRERTSGESKLQGKKAVAVVLTVTGTLIAAKLLRSRRG